MKPASPVLKHLASTQNVAGRHQPEFLELPYLTVRDPNGVECEISRYTMSLRERIKVLFTGSVYLEILTMEKFVHPRRLSVDCPKV